MSTVTVVTDGGKGRCDRFDDVCTGTGLSQSGQMGTQHLVLSGSYSILMISSRRVLWMQAVVVAPHRTVTTAALSLGACMVTAMPSGCPGGIGGFHTGPSPCLYRMQ